MSEFADTSCPACQRREPSSSRRGTSGKNSNIFGLALTRRSSQRSCVGHYCSAVRPRFGVCSGACGAPNTSPKRASNFKAIWRRRTRRRRRPEFGREGATQTACRASADAKKVKLIQMRASRKLFNNRKRFLRRFFSSRRPVPPFAAAFLHPFDGNCREIN